MSKSIASLFFDDFNLRLSDILQKTRTNMLDHWHDPVEWVVDSLYHFTDITDNAVENFFNSQKDSLYLR